MTHTLQPIPNAPAIAAAGRLTGVTKRYGDVEALSEVDLSLPQGQVTALLGPNGAGKTTAVNCLLGLIRPDSGSARVFGGDPQDPRHRRRTGVMLQISGIPETLTVREHVTLFSSYYPAPLAVEPVIATAGLAELADRKAGELSGGERQRLLFALAICGDPDLLILDEPTVGLDVDARRAFWVSVRELVAAGRTVLLTTHYLEEADDLADRIVLLDHGRVVADASPAEIKARAAARKITCRTSLDRVALLELPGATEVRPRGGVTEILTGAAEDLVRELLRRDSSLTDLGVSGAGLEEAFLHLTGRDEERPDQALQEGAA